MLNDYTNLGKELKYDSICDRFINRRMAQKFYDKALTIGLKGRGDHWFNGKKPGPNNLEVVGSSLRATALYIMPKVRHQTVISRLADWEGIEKVIFFN
ncbi:hypothetical protein CsSME_00024647 [Camellia sinensis var. sinensis]